MFAWDLVSFVTSDLVEILSGERSGVFVQVTLLSLFAAANGLEAQGFTKSRKVGSSYEDKAVQFSLDGCLKPSFGIVEVSAWSLPPIF